jgi:AraC family transcriptional regulator
MQPRTTSISSKKLIGKKLRMSILNISEGLYAIFDYKGPANAALPFFRYIFETWLPASDYAIDNRPHFAMMGEKYRGNHPDSEEEIWVPVKPVISNQQHLE